MTYIGANVEQQVTFRNTSGALANPTVVNGNAKRPNGTSVAAVSVTNVSTGIYDVIYTADLAGLWFYRIEGEGNNVNAVTEGSFCVLASSVE
jgi:hypothetical protein